jgi:hypothetical protein
MIACDGGRPAATLSEYQCENDRLVRIRESARSAIELRASDGQRQLHCETPSTNARVLGSNRCEIDPEQARIYTLMMAEGSSGDWIEVLRFNRRTGELRGAHLDPTSCQLSYQSNMGG